MAEFTVLAAEKVRELPATPATDGKPAYKAKVAYRLSFEGNAADAEWFTNATTPLPQRGDVLDGEIEVGAGYKGANRFSKSGGGFGGGGGFKGKSPAEKAEIRRMHSQEMCIRWLTLLHARGKVPEDASLAWVREQVDWWEEDAQKAGAAA